MTVDELADFQKANGATIVNVNGIWWREARPFFYQPLLPFSEFAHNSVSLPLRARIGGYKHAVISEHEANSRINYFVWDEVRNYSIQKLNRKKRWNIRNGQKTITVKPVGCLHEMATSGYEAYCSFYSRTQYGYKKERNHKEHFITWAETLFRFPKVRILGAYHRGVLCAVDISYLVEDVLIDATYFCNTDHLKYQVTDVMIHALRENAAACPNIAYVYHGPVSGKKSLDDFKLMRNCKLISKPAFYHINPLAGHIIRSYMKDEYRKLIGTMELGDDIEDI